MFRPTLVVCALFAVAVAEDFEEWKALKVNRVVTARVATEMESEAKDEDKCLELVEKFPAPDDYAVAYDTVLKLCQAYERDDLGKYNKDDRTMTWFDTKSIVIGNSTRVLFAKREKREESSSISDAEIVVTIILAIFYALVITACAFLCKEEKSDIAGQMSRLEKAEEERHERASEEWERRSHEEEEAARKEAEEIEKKEAQ